ncbi:hypothetical protein HK098_003456 [Nowakowskiella sp. JEL0407]|nr:hypothetical protein HK098_003456 [Nowakowskiella sp. JEL0407]
MDKRFVGTFAKLVNSIPVTRAQDHIIKPNGSLLIESDAEPLIITGRDTSFTEYLAPRHLITLPNNIGSAEVQEVLSDTSVRLKSPFSADAIAKLSSPDVIATGLSGFSVTPHIDQSKLFDEVVSRLHAGKCVGIFPEGGSHDRSDLLPLKAGFCIMALSTMAKYDTLVNGEKMDVKIVPVALNYFHPDKFRSRAVVEFGEPVTIDRELVDMYKAGGDSKRKATEVLLDKVYRRLKGMLVTAPDYEQLMFIQAARRLYRPIHKKLDFDQTLELTRKFSAAYEKFADHPRIIDLKKRVKEYNDMLSAYGIRDHQVKTISVGGNNEVYLLLYRFLMLLSMAFVSFPGVVLNAPIIYLCQQIANSKAKEAKAASSVKLEGKDVIGTWKVITAMALVPLFYFIYSILYLFFISTATTILGKLYSSFIFSAIVLPTISFISLRAGEVGMDYFKSLRPLFIAVTLPQIGTEPLRKLRSTLQKDINDTINDLGPLYYGNKGEFEKSRIVNKQDAYQGEIDSEYVAKGKRLPDNTLRWDVVDEKESDDGVFLFAEDADDEDDWVPLDSEEVTKSPVGMKQRDRKHLIVGSRNSSRSRSREIRGR